MVSTLLPRSASFRESLSERAELLGGRVGRVLVLLEFPFDVPFRFPASAREGKGDRKIKLDRVGPPPGLCARYLLDDARALHVTHCEVGPPRERLGGFLPSAER